MAGKKVIREVPVEVLVTDGGEFALTSVLCQELDLVSHWHLQLYFSFFLDLYEEPCQG